MQAAKSLRDKELESVCENGDKQNRRQLAWLFNSNKTGRATDISSAYIKEKFL